MSKNKAKRPNGTGGTRGLQTKPLAARLRPPNVHYKDMGPAPPRPRLGLLSQKLVAAAHETKKAQESEKKSLQERGYSVRLQRIGELEALFDKSSHQKR